jgi:hypothetical protein
VTILTGAFDARAALPWVSRGPIQREGVVAFDVGLGVGHRPDIDGAGLNLELAWAVTHAVELGFRDGIRFGDKGQALQADQYGRLYDTETYGTGFEQVANPEFRLRGVLVRGDVHLSLEGRVYLPVESGTRAGVMFGVPFGVHLGHSARLDTGVFVPVLFYDPARTVVSIPAELWFQPTARFWLGPIAALRFHNDPGAFTQLLLGFGLGYQLSAPVDFKAQFIFPYINGSPDQGNGGKSFGAGAGLQFRIE